MPFCLAAAEHTDHALDPLPIYVGRISHMPRFTVPGPVGHIGYAPSIIAFNIVPGRVGHLSYAANSIAFLYGIAICEQIWN
jgi:hypothetical protein